MYAIRSYYVDNGRIFGNTEVEGEPLRFTLGAGEVFPALEREICGMVKA